MSLMKRVLLVLTAFGVANVAAFIILSSLGIERGEWRYAVAIGVIVAIVSAVWRLTAQKDQPPRISN
jgi:sugar phosphate permease